MTKVKFQTSKGDIVLELDEVKAPVTVANFLDYVKSGYFCGTIFHRVINGFMVQCGGLTANMKDKPGNKPIINEAANGLQNKRGTVAMARTNDPNSATSQFFINHIDNDFLNYKSPANPGYAVFGKVCDGMDVVDEIAEVETKMVGHYDDVPVEKIEIIATELV